MRSILERRLQISGILILMGLVTELISLRWAHPTAFLLFVIIGGVFLISGILFYLYSLIAQREQQP